MTTPESTNGFERRIAVIEKYMEALSDERQRAIEVASDEREKAAQALRVALERAIHEGDERLREHVTNQVMQIREALISADKLELARVSRVEEMADARFHERDIRFDSAAKTTVASAEQRFMTLKEAASEQNKSNTLAITKSEAQTTETINKLTELFKTTTDALRDKIDDVKAEVNGARSIRQGGQEQRTESRAQISSTSAAIGIVVALLAALSLYLGTHQTKPVVVTPTVTAPTP